MKRGLALLLLSELVTLSFGASPVYLGYQDSLGQYTFGYSAPSSARSEIRSADGLTTGSFSYIDGAGVIQSARYEADDDGFRIAATNLPQAPQPVVDTPEVTAARNEHLKLLALAERMALEEAQLEGKVVEVPEEVPSEVQVKNLNLSQDQMQNEKTIQIPEGSKDNPEVAEGIRRNFMVEGMKDNFMVPEETKDSMAPERTQENSMLPQPVKEMLEMKEDGSKQELLARSAQVVDFPQTAGANLPQDTTPAHTALLKSAEESQPGQFQFQTKAQNKVGGRPGQKEGNRTRSKPKPANRVSQKVETQPQFSYNFANIRGSPEHLPPFQANIRGIPVQVPPFQANIRGSPVQVPPFQAQPYYTPYSYFPFTYPYPYNLGYSPYRYESYYLF